MSETNKNINDFDLFMKSVLDEGREEVSADIWEGISEGLDKAAHRRTVVLWWRRSIVGTAVAAAIALAVIFSHERGVEALPESAGKDLIAVAEPARIYESHTIPAPEAIMMAHVRNTAPTRKDTYPATASESISQTEITSEEIIEERPQETVAPKKQETATEEYFPEDWTETAKKTKRGVSITFSGLAATNNAQSQNRLSPMKLPTITSAPKKSGITETSTKSLYGIPVSIGAGVKIDLSQRWSLGVGLNYSLLARKFYGKYTEVTESGSIASSTSSDILNNQHFIGIPVNAFYSIINKNRVNFYAYAGGTVEKCLSDNYNVLNTPIRHKEHPTGLQLSANAGIGVEFRLGNHLGLYIDPSLRYYFDNGQPKSIRTVQPLMMGFEIGFRALL